MLPEYSEAIRNRIWNLPYPIGFGRDFSLWSHDPLPLLRKILRDYPVCHLHRKHNHWLVRSIYKPAERWVDDLRICVT